MTNAATIVANYQSAVDAGDFVAARKLLRDDLAFHGPIDRFTSAEPLLESLKKLHPIVERIDVKKTFMDGDEHRGGRRVHRRVVSGEG